MSITDYLPNLLNAYRNCNDILSYEVNELAQSYIANKTLNSVLAHVVNYFFNSSDAPPYECNFKLSLVSELFYLLKTNITYDKYQYEKLFTTILTKLNDTSTDDDLQTREVVLSLIKRIFEHMIFTDADINLVNEILTKCNHTVKIFKVNNIHNKRDIHLYQDVIRSYSTIMKSIHVYKYKQYLLPTIYYDFYQNMITHLQEISQCIQDIELLTCTKCMVVYNYTTDDVIDPSSISSTQENNQSHYQTDEMNIDSDEDDSSYEDDDSIEEWENEENEKNEENTSEQSLLDNNNHHHHHHHHHEKKCIHLKGYHYTDSILILLKSLEWIFPAYMSQLLSNHIQSNKSATTNSIMNTKVTTTTNTSSNASATANIATNSSNNTISNSTSSSSNGSHTTNIASNISSSSNASSSNNFTFNFSPDDQIDSTNTPSSNKNTKNSITAPSNRLNSTLSSSSSSSFLLPCTPQHMITSLHNLTHSLLICVIHSALMHDAYYTLFHQSYTVLRQLNSLIDYDTIATTTTTTIPDHIIRKDIIHTGNMNMISLILKLLPKIKIDSTLDIKRYEYIYMYLEVIYDYQIDMWCHPLGSGATTMKNHTHNLSKASISKDINVSSLKHAKEKVKINQDQAEIIHSFQLLLYEVIQYIQNDVNLILKYMDQIYNVSTITSNTATTTNCTDINDITQEEVTKCITPILSNNQDNDDKYTLESIEILLKTHDGKISMMSAEYKNYYEAITDVTESGIKLCHTILETSSYFNISIPKLPVIAECNNSSSSSDDDNTTSVAYLEWYLQKADHQSFLDLIINQYLHTSQLFPLLYTSFVVDNQRNLDVHDTNIFVLPPIRVWGTQWIYTSIYSQLNHLLERIATLSKTVTVASLEYMFTIDRLCVLLETISELCDHGCHDLFNISTLLMSANIRVTTATTTSTSSMIDDTNHITIESNSNTADMNPGSYEDMKKPLISELSHLLLSMYENPFLPLNTMSYWKYFLHITTTPHTVYMDKKAVKQSLTMKQTLLLKSTSKKQLLDLSEKSHYELDMGDMMTDMKESYSEIRYIWWDTIHKLVQMYESKSPSTSEDSNDQQSKNLSQGDDSNNNNNNDDDGNEDHSMCVDTNIDNTAIIHPISATTVNKCLSSVFYTEYMRILLNEICICHLYIHNFQQNIQGNTAVENENKSSKKSKSQVTKSEFDHSDDVYSYIPSILEKMNDFLSAESTCVEERLSTLLQEHLTISTPELILSNQSNINIKVNILHDIYKALYYVTRCVYHIQGLQYNTTTHSVFSPKTNKKNKKKKLHLGDDMQELMESQIELLTKMIQILHEIKVINFDTYELTLPPQILNSLLSVKLDHHSTSKSHSNTISKNTNITTNRGNKDDTLQDTEQSHMMLLEKIDVYHTNWKQLLRHISCLITLN